jgi:hypothetical protein
MRDKLEPCDKAIRTLCKAEGLDPDSPYLIFIFDPEKCDAKTFTRANAAMLFYAAEALLADLATEEKTGCAHCDAMIDVATLGQRTISDAIDNIPREHGPLANDIN